MSRAIEKSDINRALSQHSCVILKGYNELSFYLLLQNFRDQTTSYEYEAINNRSHPDLLIADAREIKVSDVREIISSLSAHPARWNYRYFVLLYADRLNGESSQSLLKTLEEPPKTLKILLTSNNPQLLPETILSRSLLLNIANTTESETTEILNELKFQEPNWRAVASGGDVDCAVQMDLETTKEWHKLMSSVLAGSIPDAELPFNWVDLLGTDKLLESAEATQIACYNLFLSIFNKKFENGLINKIAQQVVEERERVMRGRSNKFELSMLMVNLYAYLKAYVRRK